MNIPRIALVSVLVGQCLATGWAQAPGGDQMDAQGGAVSPPPGPPPRMDRSQGGDRGIKRFLENLPPEIRQRFMQAREQALQDPKMQDLQKKMEDAGRAFREAMRAKMQEIDPSLAEYIKKEAARPDMADADGPKGPGGKDGPGKGKGGSDGGPGMARLSDTERENYLAARAKAKTDPTVEAAKAKLEAATTPDERHAAGDAFGKAMRDAILKIDPSLKPVLEKMTPPQSPAPGKPAQPPAPSASPAGMEMN